MPRSTVPDYVLERLIELVRDCPAVFDFTMKEHKDSVFLNNTWISITANMNFEGKTVEFWKTRWRTLRDTYVRKRRKMKEMKNAPDAVAAKKWKFYDVLSFLDPYISDGSIDSEFIIPDGRYSGNPTELQGNTDLSARYYDQEGVDLDAEEESAGSGDDMPKCSVVPSGSQSALWGIKNINGIRYAPSPPVRRGNKREVDSGMLDLCPCHSSKKIKEDVKERDEDEAFLEPYALRLKKLPKDIKGIVQLQIAQLFFNAENPDLPQQPITPLFQQPQLSVIQPRPSEEDQSMCDTDEDSSTSPEPEQKPTSSILPHAKSELLE